VSHDERQECIQLIDEAVEAGSRVEQACETLGLSPETLRRWQSNPLAEDRRSGPLTPSPAALTEAEKAMIVEIVSSLRFRDKSPWQIVPTLADEGRYVASEASFYRVMREKKLLAHRGRTRRAKKRTPPCLVARRPNELWSWDITYLLSPIAGIFFRLYLVMDVFSRKIVGWEVHEREDAGLAAVLVERICRDEGIARGRLTLHADNGGAMKGATLLATLERLGVVPSHSRPRCSDDNAFSETLYKTMKYRPEYPDGPFADIEQARTWVARFVAWYNEQHLHSEIQYVTPACRHRGEDRQVLEKRERVYEAAQKRRPDRWRGETRNWDFVAEVSLNGHHRREEKPTLNTSEQQDQLKLEESVAA
jgi:transposase InsO family protein